MTLVVSEKIFEDLVPRCDKTECDGVVKPGRNINDKSTTRSLIKPDSPVLEIIYLTTKET